MNVVQDVDLLGYTDGLSHLAKHVVLWLAFLFAVRQPAVWVQR